MDKRQTGGPKGPGSVSPLPRTPLADLHPDLREPRPASGCGPPEEPRPATNPSPPGGLRPASEPRPAADPAPPAEFNTASEPGPPKGPRVNGRSTEPRSQKPNSQSQPSSPSPAAHRGRRPASSELLPSGGSVLPLREEPVSMETEYQRSFKGLAPPAAPRLRKHLEHQTVPVFHTHKGNKKRRAEPDNTPCPQVDTPTLPLPRRRHRMLTEYQSSFRSPLHRTQGGSRATDLNVTQLQALREEASLYRRRGWGLHFSRKHLNQLLSEHNALWEPSDSTAATTSDLPEEPEEEASGRHPDSSSVVSSAAGPPSERVLEAEDEEPEREKPRVPTQRNKMEPYRRTRVPTPAAGCAALHSKPTHQEVSPHTQGCGTTVSIATEEEVRQGPGSEVVSDPPCSPGARWKQASPQAPPPAAQHTQAPPPQYCIRGLMRHPDFQHNGDLGLRCRAPRCSEEDDRLSVMSWHSAASCSAASAVLERAQRRRENFWGKS